MKQRSVMEETNIDMAEVEQQSDLQVELNPEACVYCSTEDSEPLLSNRDPMGVNTCLKVTFEDVIAEPRSVHSFDTVWVWSHALFEACRLWSYRIVSLLLAVPLSLVAGMLFALLSCLHIWIIVPFIQLFLIGMSWLQIIWACVLDFIVAPFYSSLGLCCSAITVHMARE